MALSTILYDAPGGNLLYDFSGLAEELECSTNGHGFRDAAFRLPSPIRQSLRVYDRPGLPWLVTSWKGQIVWEGRLNKASLTDIDLKVQALGGWSAYRDTLYTAFWSSTSVTDFEQVETTQVANRKPKLYTMDLNNRIFIGLTKNSAYGTGGDVGEYYLDTPHSGSRAFQQVTFAYNVDLPTGWKAVLNYYTASNFGGAAVAWSVTSAGAPLSGVNVTVSIPSGVTIGFYIFNDSGAVYTYTGENGAKFARWTDVRVQSTTASVTADNIIKDLRSAVAAINPTLVASDTSLIQAPAVDLPDEIYLDQRPADIMKRLAGIGDSQTPPRQWEIAVWEGRRLAFRPQGSAGRTWYVDVDRLDIERSLDELANSVYSLYRDAAGDDVRTAASTDAASVAQHGLTRQEMVSARTSNSALAITQRNAQLQDRKTVKPATRVPIQALYDGYGSRYPLFYARANDTIVIRNIPSHLSATIDRIRSFRLAETTYRAHMDSLDGVPEVPLSSVAFLLGRHEANIH